MSACTACNTEFTCGCLASAMKVAEATAAAGGQPALDRLVKLIKGALEGGGWRYPDSERLCQFVGRDRRLQELTKELIDALAAARTVPHATASPETSLLAEEYRHE